MLRHTIISNVNNFWLPDIFVAQLPKYIINNIYNAITIFNKSIDHIRNVFKYNPFRL